MHSGHVSGARLQPEDAQKHTAPCGGLGVDVSNTTCAGSVRACACLCVSVAVTMDVRSRLMALQKAA